MAPPPSELDSSQVLPRVFDEANGRLRVDTEAIVTGSGQLEVNIDHTEDSIRLGDGTGYITSTVGGGKRALDVNVVSTSSIPPTTPFNANIPLATAGNEYPYTIPNNTVKLQFRGRLSSSIRYAFSVNGTNTVYYTVSRGAIEKFDSVNMVGQTIYFQSDKNGEVIEITGFNT
jgi:hypothetical protein